jgi:hypothetical protein
LEPAMSNSEQLCRPHVPARTPTIEVRVYRDGQFIFSRRCDSEEETAEAVRGWEEVDGVVCEVDDITDGSRHGHVIEAEPWYDEAWSGAAAERLAGCTSR